MDDQPENPVSKLTTEETNTGLEGPETTRVPERTPEIEQHVKEGASQRDDVDASQHGAEQEDAQKPGV